MMKKLLLIGSGDMHFSVMEHLQQKPDNNIATVLVKPVLHGIDDSTAGLWTQASLKARKVVPQLEFSQSSNMVSVADELRALDVSHNTAIFRSGYKFTYDFISLDTEQETDISWFAILGDRLLSVKPLERFWHHWQQVVIHSSTFHLFRLAIIGDDLLSIRIAKTVCDTLEKRGTNYKLELVISDDLELQVSNSCMHEHIKQLCLHYSVDTHYAQAAGTNTGVILSNGTELWVDRVIVASKVRLPPWLEITELSRDVNGFVIVDAEHRSVSHRNVFVNGDLMAEQSVACLQKLSHVCAGMKILQALDRS